MTHRPINPRVAALALALLGSVAQAQVEVVDPPLEHNFGKIPLNATYATQYFSVTNRGSAPVVLGQAVVDGQMATCAALGCPAVAPSDFVVLSHSDGCSGQTLQPAQGCSTLVSFVPQGVGARTARLVFPVQGAAEATRVVAGTGVAQPIDCVLDWAERTYPTLLTQPTPTFVYQAFHARCYQGGSLCVGADTALPTTAPASVYLYQGGQMVRYADLSVLAAQATYPAPNSRSCSQAAE